MRKSKRPGDRRPGFQLLREERRHDRALHLNASAESELAETKDLRDADQKYLDDTTAVCEQKATDFESRQQLRANVRRRLA